MTGLFITIVVDQWLDSEDHFAAITGIIVSTLSLVLFGADRFLVPAMIGIAVILLIKMPRKVSESDKGEQQAHSLTESVEVSDSGRAAMLPGEEVPHDK